jgi:hypothetical protein
MITTRLVRFEYPELHPELSKCSKKHNDLMDTGIEEDEGVT